ncbi:hypothetical protein TNCV_4557421 [Trichonephila clavipes]|nr:hypothetical protein TNCV_4557421 [Trichonephila clavipes]
MTYYYRLDHFLRWRAVVRLEASQSLADETRWLQMTQNWSPGFEINSKQVVLSPGRTAQVTTDHRHLYRIVT